MCARDPALADRAFCQPLVQAGERIFGSGERAGELGPGQLSLLPPDFKQEKVRYCLGLGVRSGPIFR